MDRLAGRVADVWREHAAVRICIYAIALGLVATALAKMAYPAMFSTFAPYDDEGYVLLSLHEYVDGGALYDEVYSQYGPAFYVILGGAFELSGSETTHNAGRMLTMIVWLSGSVLCGAVVLRITGRLALALLAQLLSFLWLAAAIPEPMHPGGWLAFALACLLGTAAFVIPRKAAAGLFIAGLICGGVLLTKVNVGLFTLAAIAFAVVLATPILRRVRALRVCVLLLFVATPFVLMLQDLDVSWGLRYAVVVGASALALVLATARDDVTDGLSLGHVGWLAGGVATAVALVVATVVLQGTTPMALLDGILLEPLGQNEAFVIPLGVPAIAAPWAAVNVLAAATFAWASVRRPHSRLLARLLPPLRLIAGIAILVALLGVGPFAQRGVSFGVVAPMAWIVTTPIQAAPRARYEVFVRYLIAALAAMQLMHAYPVAGSQYYWSLFLFVVLGCVMVGDGIRELRGSPLVWAPALTWRRLAVAAVLILLVWGVRDPLGEFERTTAPAYDANAPVPALYGATRLRLWPKQGEIYSAITRHLERSCATFISYPGLNSFYLFTRTEPPTSANAGAWMFLFDDEAQAEIVADVRDESGLCVLRSREVAAGWAHANPIPQRPLVSYIERRFHTFKRIDGYELMRLDGGGQPK